MDGKKLLQELKDANIIREEDVGNLLRESKNLGKSIEQTVYDHKITSEEEVGKIKSKNLKIPYRAVDKETIDEAVLKLIPAETARKYEMIPLEMKNGTLIVGMVNPENLAAQEALKYLAKEQKVNLGVYLITPSDLKDTLRKFGGFRSDIESAVDAMNIQPGEGLSDFQKIVQLEDNLGQESSEAPIIRIVASMLKEAVNLEASDIHIEPQRSRLRIRFRMDGKLEEYLTFPPELQYAIVSRIKVLSNLKLDETRVPQDGRFRSKIFDREIDFRISTFPTPTGEKIALRVLDPKTGLRTLDELGVSEFNRKRIDEALNRPYGMVLITGPTGSGKTTTLYALLQIMNKEEVNVVSLEDPVEYTVDGINQSQIKPEINYTFASGLREILRQDPDIIMVGEIRDGETAELAVHAALTGHIVLSTLHTNNSIGVIPRLVNMGIEPFLLPSVLSAMVSQRLISKICQDCKEQIDVPENIAKEIDYALGAMDQVQRSKYTAPYKTWKAAGCTVCKHRGVTGRVALYEILQMSPAIADIVSKGSINENDIYAEAKKQGMIFLRQDGIMKALDGLVSIEEVLKETEKIM
ncbi:MAG: hypothetical protein COU08_03800 [Candidatus Harrisonbacteria bacterium CG10_big_fil_rev_8_21_14_0_10_42_17]|uniref:Bacterial type II secretion system protein E domain-containing protein n=1 Tax=Candidatus Harrisonbacteria bacterium CG10_big_fil_rev_8_21_14_0_10_42_17 TaxID=1974584 RepID=A0A2M6WHB2_9BACT|nr:MAG: hypothetical protein COU08_03800 [Candidatus Harrisonbacteria bacterium CG10_big_fil_rev_8_21_14_0_10_42_17]